LSRCVSKEALDGAKRLYQHARGCYHAVGSWSGEEMWTGFSDLGAQYIFSGGMSERHWIELEGPSLWLVAALN